MTLSGKTIQKNLKIGQLLLKTFSFSIVFLNTVNAQSDILDIRADFPGGNIRIDSVRDNRVYLRPDLRDTGQEWFYWYFSVKSETSDTLHFYLTRPDCLTNKGPAFSSDNGLNWRWMEKDFTENSFSYFVEAGEEIRFSMGMPYTQRHLDLFLEPLLRHNAPKVETLCQTPKGRRTEKLIIGPRSSKKVRQRVLITARHHSCEMMANYVLEGMIASLLSDVPEMRKVRKKTEFWIVPFMDKDGVEDGDQGKSRMPRDHNRDYNDESIYCSTRALRTTVPDWIRGSSLVAIDLHCPWIKGNLNEHIYLVGNAREKIAGEQEVFRKLLAENNFGTVKYDYEKGFVPFGTAWNTAKNYQLGMSFGAWASTLDETRLSTTLEIPYSLNSGQTLTPENLRSFGKDLAFSITAYLK